MLFFLSLLGIVRQMLFHLIDLVNISRVIAWIYNSDGSGQIPTWNLTRAKKPKTDPRGKKNWSNLSVGWNGSKVFGQWEILSIGIPKYNPNISDHITNFQIDLKDSKRSSPWIISVEWIKFSPILNNGTYIYSTRKVDWKYTNFEFIW